MKLYEANERFIITRPIAAGTYHLLIFYFNYYFIFHETLLVYNTKDIDFLPLFLYI